MTRSTRGKAYQSSWVGDDNDDYFERTVTDHSGMTSRTASDLSSESIQSMEEPETRSPVKKKKKSRSSSLSPEKRMRQRVPPRRLPKSRSSRRFEDDAEVDDLLIYDLVDFEDYGRHDQPPSPATTKIRRRSLGNTHFVPSNVVPSNDVSKGHCSSSKRKSLEKSRRKSSRSINSSGSSSSNDRWDNAVSSSPRKAPDDRRKNLARKNSKVHLIVEDKPDSFSHQQHGPRPERNDEKHVDRRKLLTRTQSGHGSMKQLEMLQRSASDLYAMEAAVNDEDSSIDSSVNSSSAPSSSPRHRAMPPVSHIHTESPHKHKKQDLSPNSYHGERRRTKILNRGGEVPIPVSPSKANQYLAESTRGMIERYDKIIEEHNSCRRLTRPPSRRHLQAASKPGYLGEKTMSGILKVYDDIILD